MTCSGFDLASAFTSGDDRKALNSFDKPARLDHHQGRRTSLAPSIAASADKVLTAQEHPVHPCPPHP